MDERTTPPGAGDELYLDVLDIDIDNEEAAIHQIGKTITASAADLASWANPETMLGDLLAERYKLTRLIGDGGMGAVFEGRHILIDKQVAVKVLHPDFSRNPKDVQSFLLEARAASRIKHDHVVDITDFGYTPKSQAFLVMEYLQGEDLADTLYNEGPFHWERAAHMVRQIARALESAHAQGVIHRDLKPENFFRIHHNGDPDFIKVVDFGIAKVSDPDFQTSSSSGTSTSLVGTPEYIAPELITGSEPTPAADVYALGIVLYQMLTGTTPFAGENVMDIFSQAMLDEAVPPRVKYPQADIPPEVDELVMRAIARDPANRIQTAGAFLAILDRVRDEEESRRAGLLAALLKTPARRWMTVVTIATVALILGGLLMLQFGRMFGGDAGKEVADANSSQGQVAATGLSAGPPVDPNASARSATGQTTAQPEPTDDTEVTTETGGDSDGGTEQTDSTDAGDSTDTSEAQTDSDTDTDPTEGDEAEAKAGRTLPSTLSEANFRRKLRQSQAKVRKRCGNKGVPGMGVTVEVHVRASGRVAKVVQKGTMAGTSLGTCVAKVVRSIQFRPARRSSKHLKVIKI